MQVKSVFFNLFICLLVYLFIYYSHCVHAYKLIFSHKICYSYFHTQNTYRQTMFVCCVNVMSVRVSECIVIRPAVGMRRN